MELHSNDSIIELASGVDSLYLTGRSILPDSLVEQLESARALAGINGEAVPLVLGTERFLVGWGPLNKHRFRLDHRHATIGMTFKESMPTLFIQPHAQFIHTVGVQEVVQWCRSTFAAILGHIEWQVSRIDLFMDVQGWPLTADDRRDFLCRAKARRTWEDDDDLTGLGWGAGDSVLARIYDKTRESSVKGTDWWPSVWADSYRSDERVVRIEFQLRRAALRDFGFSDPDQVLDNLRSLWDYLTGKWLSLREPTGDSNRSRRPVAHAWEQIQSAELAGAPIGADLMRAGAREGSLRLLLPALVGYATKAGAHLDAESGDELIDALRRLFAKDARLRGVTIEQRLAMQRRRLGLA